MTARSYPFAFGVSSSNAEAWFDYWWKPQYSGAVYWNVYTAVRADVPDDLLRVLEPREGAYWCVVYSSPPLVIYSGASPPSTGYPVNRMVAVSDLWRSLDDDENSTMTVDIDNGDGKISDILSAINSRDALELYAKLNGEVNRLFAGRVSKLPLISSTVKLTAEA